MTQNETRGEANVKRNTRKEPPPEVGRSVVKKHEESPREANRRQRWKKDMRN